MSPETRSTAPDCICLAVRQAGRNILPLERDGLIRIEPAASDRRRKGLHLTRRGEKRLETAVKGWAQAQARFESTFGSGRTSDLRALLHAVTATQLGPEDAVARGAEA